MWRTDILSIFHFNVILMCSWRYSCDRILICLVTGVEIVKNSWSCKTFITSLYLKARELKMLWMLCNPWMMTWWLNYDILEEKLIFLSIHKLKINIRSLMTELSYVDEFCFVQSTSYRKSISFKMVFIILNSKRKIMRFYTWAIRR